MDGVYERTDIAVQQLRKDGSTIVDSSVTEPVLGVKLLTRIKDRMRDYELLDVPKTIVTARKR